jgi:hypothetical protein
MDGDDEHMDSREPIYRKICADCERPALTLDHSGDAYCAEHADVFIAIEDTGGVDEVEIAVLLVHRHLVTEIG